VRAFLSGLAVCTVQPPNLKPLKLGGVKRREEKKRRRKKKKNE
jgi:hypothetical protein